MNSNVEPWALCCASAIGVFAHRVVFISGEWHEYGATLCVTHLAVYNITGILLWLVSNTTVSQATTSATTLASCYLVSMYTSMIAYRLLQHRLHPFPGPFLARITNLWHVWQCRKSKNHLVLDSLHKKYGDFVRTGPSEITIFDADAFTQISGPRSKCIRTEWYELLPPWTSILSTRSHDIHRDRRKAWNKAFSIQAIRSYEPRMIANCKKFGSFIEQAATLDHSVNVTDLCYWYSFDTMGEFAFASPFGMLNNKKYQPAIALLRRAFDLLGPFTSVAWLPRLAFSISPNVGRLKAWKQLFDFCGEQMDKRLQTDPETPDVASHLISAAVSKGMNPADKDLLDGDSVVLIIAGSDTTAPLLTFILYNLAKYPEHAEKLFHEVYDVDVHDHKALQNLPHLNAIIEETMRLHPVLPTAVQRQTPVDGITIAGRHIPGDITVIAPRYTIGRRERYFERANDFIPERWYCWPQMVRERHAHVPFSLGKYSCVGANLAMMNIRLTITATVQKYQINFVPGTNPHLVYTEAKDHYTMVAGPLFLSFSARKSDQNSRPA